MIAEEERAHWDSVSGDDPETMIRHGDWAQSIEHDLARVDVGDEGPILDLGCGIGRLTVAYARRHKVWTIGVDASAKMLARAESDWRPRHLVEVGYLLGDGRTLPPLPELGGAFSVLMFQHIPREAQQSYVAQVAEKLRPGARFVFQTVIGAEDTFLSHQVDKEEPAAWCEAAGLEVEQSREAGWPWWLWVNARQPQDRRVV